MGKDIRWVECLLHLNLEEDFVPLRCDFDTNNPQRSFMVVTKVKAFPP